MSASRFQQPTPDQLERFVSGDPVAASEVMELIVPQLVRHAVARWGQDYEREDLESVVHDVAWEACRPPVRYRPGASLLTTYLINLIEKRVVTIQAAGPASVDDRRRSAPRR